MKKVKTIIGVEEQPESGCWIVYHTVPGMIPGTHHAYAFPLMALGYRAAEYGFDPMDADSLIRFVLHEISDPRMQISDANHPHFLYNTTEELAREAALKRLATVEADTVHHDPDGHLNKLKRAYLDEWTSDFHRSHQENVRSLRKHRMKALERGSQ